MEIRFLGQSCVELSEGDARVLVDPFLTGNPKAAVSADDVNPTHILLTHGHGDHYGDTVEIAKRTGAPVLAIVEIANELADLGLETSDPNLGGTVGLRLGLGEARAGLAHVDDARTGRSARRPAC